jgi:putative salt-induced outer membrane protein YdiY
MKVVVFLVMFSCLVTQAKDVVPVVEVSRFFGESEASAVVIGGNSTSETFGAKTKNTYAFDEFDLGTVFGRYVRTSTGGTENNKYWEAGLRYERIFTKEVLSGFLQHKVEHDPYNGIYIQRDSSDIGAKYIFVVNDDFNWFGELGYRTSKVYTGTTDTASFVRLYTEASMKISANTNTKLWGEYLHNLKNSNQYQYNAEASLSVSMTSILSLKTAILLNHNEALASPLQKDTTTWTTALVAKY